jgi:hypothetical protein
MARRAFGECISCHKPIEPPYLQFVVQWLEQESGQDPRIHSWEEVDISNYCAGRVNADDLYRLVSDGEGEG